MKDFFDTWKFKILVGIAVFLVGIMAYAGANGRLTAAPQELLSVAAAPFQKVAAVVSGGVASLWEKYTSIDDVMAENETLKAENAELRQQMVDYDRVKAENQAYKALESIQSQRPEMSYLSSFVIGRDPLDSFYGFTLDRGTLDGVAVNDAVVSDQGYLLGMVVEAEPTSCKVMTVLHPNFNAAGVEDVVNTGHCVTDRLGIADIADVELDLLGVLRVLGLKLMAHIVLLLLVTREDTNLLQVRIQEVLQNGRTKRTSTTSDHKGCVIKCRHFYSSSFHLI